MIDMIDMYIDPNEGDAAEDERQLVINDEMMDRAHAESIDR